MQKTQKSVSKKQNVNLTEAAQLKKNKIHVDSLEENQKQFIKSNRLTLKTKKRFKSKKHNFFAEKLIKLF